MITVDDFNFSGKRALVRVDFNVPLDKTTFAVTDNTRLKAAVPTIKKILNDGGSVVLMSHLGRPLKKLKEDGSVDVQKFTLKHTIAEISKLLNVEVLFTDNCIGTQAMDMAQNLKPGQVLLLENLRFHKGEEKGDVEFAKQLAALGNVYVNDAFGTAHRAHASTAVIAQFFPGAKMFGYVMANEIKNAEKVMLHAGKPFTAIMGGAKVSDKILIIEQLMSRCNHIIIGGGMAYTFFKAMGGQIGSSLCEEDKLDLAKEILKRAEQSGVKFHLPVDSVLADKFDNDAQVSYSDNMHIPDGWMGLDIGKKAVEEFSAIIKDSKTILWNGPMGVFEMEKFSAGTKAIAQAVADATAKGAFSLIGGGDSAAAVNKFGMSDKVSYVSTGGGALLEYFEGKELPGIKMVMES
ncbi:MAG TPA: phosphoglycerate kinase [Bacteroidia bacterium]|nr:phosphoglycerate kinase [Bacteroidota bacterium]MCB8931454.1 phosphoglycerate kinase [Bacteroidia bacterium]MCW5930106.1 phosphoglycerate kinase [Bacteroidota bacterium]HNR48865.1 phosphoglycerate kinase [Bacteroidia bacterium]HNT82822.1 phosphoglycerate kinase [Bacteroidia bacterium]